MALLFALLIILIFGFVPMIFYASVMWWLDRYEKEPWYLLVLVFAWGSVPAIVIGLIAQLATGMAMHLAHVQPFTMDLTMATIAAPITEELGKGVAVLLIFLIFRKEVDSVMDGIVYGSLVGFGFAATENVLYFLSGLAQAGIEMVLLLAFLRAFIFGLNHAFFTAFTGIGLALARHARSMPVRILAPFAGLTLAMTFHALHNLGASLAAVNAAWFAVSILADGAGVVGICVLMIFALNQEKRWIATELQEEIDRGLISEREYRIIVSSMRRSGRLWAALFMHGPIQCWNLQSFYHTATELAFSKRHYRELGDDPLGPRKIKDLRDKLDEIRARLRVQPA